MTPVQEIARRRTFAIISHPDAGKTTLTEKFLLYGNAIHLAGTVTARKSQRATTSDWMELEKQRGISISSTVLQFDYQGYAVNLLDTPGHKDFSEDTYRVLTAVDAALMVIDAAKGIEPQTRKLFEVCKRRGVPVFTFMNKCDRPTLNPIDLLDELERVLGLTPCPVTWPLGNGPGFRGIYDRRSKEVHLFERTPHGAYRAPVNVTGLTDPVVRDKLDDYTFDQVSEQIDILDGASAPFDLAEVQAGRQTPVFFGSAMNNFGIQILLEGFLQNSIPPTTRRSVSLSVPGAPAPTGAREIPVTHEKFSAFVFKIQANMDPKHRDRIAFVRVCSGKFERGIKLRQRSTGKTLSVNNAITFMAQDRNTTDEAWPGDIIGIPNHGTVLLGDAFSEGEDLKFTGIPCFAPEHFRRAQIRNPMKMKQLQKGLQQLAEEGATQLFKPIHSNDLILGAVGTLQFDVVAHRLEFEYGVDCLFEPYPVATARWLRGDDLAIRALADKAGVNVALDGAGDYVYLAPNRVNLSMTQERHPEVKFLETREIH